jgi:GT2 family glycosyltransferase
MFAVWRRRRSIAMARQGAVAMEQGDWSEACRLFSQAVRLRPDRVELNVQYAHALKEASRYDEAREQYSLSAGASDDGLYQLGLLEANLGNSAAAVEAWSTLLRRSPDHDAGLAGILKLGGGSHLAAALRQQLRSHSRDALTHHMDELSRALERCRELLSESTSRYSLVRPAMMIAPPTEANSESRMRVIVDARQSSPHFVRASLISLLQSRHDRWTASVIGLPDLLEHPVASMADVDERIRFARDCAEIGDGTSDINLYISAGTILTPICLSWISYLFSSQSVSACMSDWDFGVSNWDQETDHFDPQLHGCFDIDWLLTTDFPPPMVAVRAGCAEICARGAEDRRNALAQIALSKAGVAHLPIPLVTVTRIPQRAEQARQMGQAAPVWSLEPHGYAPSSGPLPSGALEIFVRHGRPPLLRVIIPTRDCPDMLEAMVESLIAQAERPDRVRITVVDNRSQDENTAYLLDKLAKQHGVGIIVYDKPFNWSKINNLAVEQTDEPLLVFANNDMRMLTADWDRQLRSQLCRSDIGALGARLLYPDGRIQHAGMLMGLADGSPIHEGHFQLDAQNAGSGQYDRVRSVSAVTGAFMGIRRDVFAEVGGFDACHFAIAYNDVDICLALRASGRRILYDPGIELLHYESATRGFNDSRLKIAWDQGELRSLHQKWHGALWRNPFLSPWWSRNAPYADIDPSASQKVREWMEFSCMGQHG